MGSSDISRLELNTVGADDRVKQADLVNNRSMMTCSWMHQILETATFGLTNALYYVLKRNFGLLHNLSLVPRPRLTYFDQLHKFPGVARLSAFFAVVHEKNGQKYFLHLTVKK